MNHTPSQDCPKCGRFVQDRPNVGLTCQCGWSKPRASASFLELKARVDEQCPFPDDLDPDELHQSERDRLFAYHAGPRQRAWRGGYGLERGDRIVYRREVWVITDTTHWDGHGGHTLVLESPDGHIRRRINVPWMWSGPSTSDRRIEVLTSSHHPVCGDCGEPWPCLEVDQSFAAKRAVDALLADVQRESDYPHLCPAGCGRRFRTERGARQHAERSAQHNPPSPPS